MRPTVNPATRSEIAARGLYSGNQLRMGTRLYSNFLVQPRRARFTTQWTADLLLWLSSPPSSLLVSLPPDDPRPEPARGEWWNPLLGRLALAILAFSSSGSVTAILSWPVPVNKRQSDLATRNNTRNYLWGSGKP